MDCTYNYTIIIPHHNIPNLLMRLLFTIPKRSDLQVIVVDDCSTRDLDVLENVKRKYTWVEWYDTSINGGGGKARNVGLQYAKGKYLVFADADDYFNLCFDEVLDKYKDTDFDLVYFTANSVHTDSYLPSNRGDNLSRMITKYLIRKNDDELKYKSTQPWAKFVNRNLVFENGITFQESPVYNDMKFSQHCDYFAKNVQGDMTAIYCVTYREGSVSSIDNPQKEIEKAKVMVDFYHFFLTHRIPYDYVPLVAPTFYDLKRLGDKQALMEYERLWHTVGISSLKIQRAALKYKIKQMLIPYYAFIKDRIK